MSSNNAKQPTNGKPQLDGKLRVEVRDLRNRLRATYSAAEIKRTAEAKGRRTPLRVFGLRIG